MITVYLYIDTDNYVNGWSSSEDSNTIEMTLPEDHDVLINPFFYKYENDELILDEVRRQEILDRRSKPQPTELELVKAELEAVKATQKQSDLAMMEMATMLFM